MLPSRNPGLFQQDSADPHSALAATAWLRSKWVQVADRPACSPQLPPIKKNVWSAKYNEQRSPAEQLMMYINREWARIQLSILEQLAPSVLRHLVLLEEKVM